MRPDRHKLPAPGIRLRKRREKDMVEKQSFGEPFIETHYIEKENGFSAEG